MPKDGSARALGLSNAVLAFVARFRLQHWGLLLSRLFAEIAILGPVAPWRAWIRRLPRFRLIAPHVDGPYYLRQLPPEWRTGAARDPVLHYGLIGCLRGYAPRPGFDPVFYRADNPDLPWARDPLAHYARRLAAAPAGSPPIPTSSLMIEAHPREAPSDGEHVLTIMHARGGGSERYLALYEATLLAEGHRVTRLARDTTRAPLFRPVRLGAPDEEGTVFDLGEDADAFRDWLHGSGITRIVLNHIVDLPPGVVTWFPALCAEAGLPFEVILHDYLMLCPRINLIARDGRYCGGPLRADCEACVSDGRGLATSVPPALWREETGRLLRAAARLVAPHADAAARFAEYWPDLAVSVWEPEDDTGIEPPRSPAPRDAEGGHGGAVDRPLRIGLIGALNAPKGFAVIRALAEHVKAQGLPLHIVLIGPSAHDASLRDAGVEIVGRYREAEAEAAIRRARPDIVFVPAIWPETWSFTLTLALKLRLPVHAFDIGAVAGRLRRLGLGTLVPLEKADDAAWLADHFMRTYGLAAPNDRKEAA
ncbi:hypothetical protein [Enterovirga rhinocerotis]|uniref:Glycosyltransferase involved in cell wall biosynthesis n=1 Tax=Enterovirga rhinocerotis TaxID=1339210 RepID=A0A4R7C0G7_9HYPH|nr:hypothetical protein [Enterovirga rhinocerotis]TDR89866.1 glycosyltransferase involved in cell wall biosynthesis [Enterovirga rhinocerotis]